MFFFLLFSEKILIFISLLKELNIVKLKKYTSSIDSDLILSMSLSEYL
jgi:hypothetical protein